MNVNSGYCGAILFTSVTCTAIGAMTFFRYNERRLSLASTDPISVAPTNLVTLDTDSSICDCAGCDAAELENDMLGSVKPYDRHIILCVSNSDWPKRIEDLKEQFPFNLVKYTEEERSTIKLRITVCELDVNCEHEGNVVGVLVYPENLLFYVKEEEMEDFSSFTCNKNHLSSYPKELRKYKHVSPPFAQIIMVCVHKERDNRCGRAGPQVIAELKIQLSSKNISEAQIKVCGSSHIGGHKYAGTLIVYPQAQWYGRVTTKTVAHLLHHIQSNTVLHKCSRGRNNGNSLAW